LIVAGLFATRFVRELPLGTCVAVSLPAGETFALPGELHPDEAAFARELPAGRRGTWVGGRLALRAALSAVGGPTALPLLATPRGAPALPAGFIGSISHKRELAVALAARADAGVRATLGIDVEIPRPFRQDVSRMVLTADERAALAALDPAARDREVLRRFATKEAIYKALDPWVGRFVSFQEVAVASAGEGGRGGLRATLALKGGEGPFAVELHDASATDVVLIAARVSAARETSPEYRPRSR
jgi:4'-phosphopantetheinyl transferase EntD